MADRFYAPVPYDEPAISLSPEESQHLATVLRKTAGDAVVLFDGLGNSAEAVVETVSKRRCIVKIVQRLPTSPQQPLRVELASAVPKGDRARWLIEKATELGADRWTPLQLARSVVDPGDGKLERLRQTVIAACKQCGRDRLLEIDATASWGNWLPKATTQGTVLIAHPSGRPAAEIRQAIADRQEPRPPGLAGAPQQIVSIAIGPEGGFTDAEIEAAVGAGAELAQLGPNILRIETAAIAALAWLRLTSSS